MTNEERRKLCDRIEELAGKLRDDSHGPNAENGKVVWPPHGEISHNDALTTLYDIADCDLDLTFYDETGNNPTDQWIVTFSGTEAYPDSPDQYARKPLKAMIAETLRIYPDDDLLKRLLKAFDEPP